MKIELEIDDLEEYFFPSWDYDEGGMVSSKDIRDKFIEQAIESCAEEMYAHSFDYSNAIRTEVGNIIRDHADEIIETVINRVTESIENKKAIVAVTPKKSELNAINKEWENYFCELIDKAIAKKFK